MRMRPDAEKVARNEDVPLESRHVLKSAQVKMPCAGDGALERDRAFKTGLIDDGTQ